MLSRVAYILCAAVMLYCTFIFQPRWEMIRGQNSFGWDACTYYWYLPSVFVYKDLKQQKFGDSIINKYEFTSEFNQSYKVENGNRVIGYSSGMALMELPGFLVAHALAKPLGYDRDGFSKPYQAAASIGGLLISLIGVWYFRKLLKYFYSDKTVAIVLLLLVFGTNYLNYAAIDTTLTHCWLFTIYVFLLLNTYHFYKKPSYKNAIFIGLLTGLAILIRPSEIVAVLIPLLWNMESLSIKAFRQKISFLSTHFKYLLAAAICTVLAGSIQVAYWLYVSGHPFVYSYQQQGFSFLKPHTWPYMFSYRSGWIIYTPLLIFSFIGLMPFLRNGKNKVAIISFFIASLYIVSAWDIWWYAGMGGRAMVQSYAVILFPMAHLVEYLLRTKVLKWIATPFFLLFTYVNIWFTYNAHAANGLYYPDGMTKEYYWAIVGRFNVDQNVHKLRDTNELFYGEPHNMQLLYRYGFEDDSTVYNPYEPISGNRSACLDADHQFSPGIKIPYHKEKATWIRATANAKALGHEWMEWRMVQFNVGFKKGDEWIKGRMIRINRYLTANDSIPTRVYFDICIPDEEFDNIQVHFWNPGSPKPVLVDDIEVWSFTE